MLVIGLTGGIASGKSLAARRFAELGVPVLDADRIAHELVMPGSPALEEIGRAFGPEMLDARGALRRDRLRRLVFADPEARRRLEAILHPRIRAEMLARLRRLDAPYAVLMIPLLVETGQHSLVDRVLVIDAPEALQRERLARRDGLDQATIGQILAAQADRETRLAAADDVVLNDAGPDELRAAVDALHRRYLRLAAHS